MESDADNELLVKRRRCRRRKAWSDAAEEHLVKLWARKISELRATRLNAHIYNAMSDEMRFFGYDYSAIDIKVKLHNMTTKYKQSKSKMKTAPNDWSLYEDVHNIMERAKELSTGDLKEDSRGKAEKSNDFDFIESESFAQSSMDLLPEEHPIQSEEEKLETKPPYAYNTRKLNNNKQRHLTNDEDSDTTTDLNAKRIKSSPADGVGNRFLNKLANTVNEVVNFIIRTENAAGRNEAFYKVLESYMAQLPEGTQDALKIEMLNTVFNKINEVDKTVNETADEAEKISKRV